MPLPSQSATNSHEPGWPRFLLGLAVVAPTLRLMKTDWNTLQKGGEEAYVNGDYREAERLYSQALRAARVEGWSPSQIVSSLNRLGNVYARQGYSTRAMLLYEEALSIVEQGPPALCADSHAATLNNIGILYTKREQYEVAQVCYKKALALKVNKTDLEEGRLLCNLGVVYHLQGCYDQAEATMMTSLQCKKRQCGSEHPAIAEHYSSIGVVYHKQGRFEDAGTVVCEGGSHKHETVQFRTSRRSHDLQQLGRVVHRSGT